jgi:hypothetical protein
MVRKLFEQAASTAKNHPEVMVGVVALSIVAVVATLIVVPMILVRMDENYFKSERTLQGRLARSHPVSRILLVLGKNLLALFLLALGVILLVLPGQGLLTLVLGVLLLDFPGRHKLQKSLISRPSILRIVNKLRARYERPPLRL